MGSIVPAGQQPFPQVFTNNEYNAIAAYYRETLKTLNTVAEVQREMMLMKNVLDVVKTKNSELEGRVTALTTDNVKINSKLDATTEENKILKDKIEVEVKQRKESEKNTNRLIYGSIGFSSLSLILGRASTGPVPEYVCRAVRDIKDILFAYFPVRLDPALPVRLPEVFQNPEGLVLVPHLLD